MSAWAHLGLEHVFSCGVTNVLCVIWIRCFVESSFSNSSQAKHFGALMLAFSWQIFCNFKLISMNKRIFWKREGNNFKLISMNKRIFWKRKCAHHFSFYERNTLDSRGTPRTFWGHNVWTLGKLTSYNVSNLIDDNKYQSELNTRMLSDKRDMEKIISNRILNNS